MAYTYRFPRPAVTVDVVVFRRSDMKVLLVRRKHEPFKGLWALPGGFVGIDEDLPEAARRELQEETSLTVRRLVQLAAYGKPGRDPRGRTVSVVYVAMAEKEARAAAGDDAAEVGWQDPKRPPELAFDHAEILAHALERLPSVSADLGLKTRYKGPSPV